MAHKPVHERRYHRKLPQQWEWPHESPHDHPREQISAVTVPRNLAGTELMVRFSDVHLRFSIAGRVSMARRRQVAERVVSALTELNERVNWYPLLHSDANPTFDESRERRVEPHQRPAWANALRAERLRLGWTLEELSHRADVNASHLAGIERGKHQPRTATLRKILAALGIHENRPYTETP